MITCNHDFSQSYYCIAEVIRNKKTGINNLNSTKKLRPSQSPPTIDCHKTLIR